MSDLRIVGTHRSHLVTAAVSRTNDVADGKISSDEAVQVVIASYKDRTKI
jgi:hypothetical protein